MKIAYRSSSAVQRHIVKNETFSLISKLFREIKLILFGKSGAFTKFFGHKCVIQCGKTKKNSNRKIFRQIKTLFHFL